MVQEDTLDTGEYILTKTDITFQLPTNFEEVEKDVVGANLTRKAMLNLWSTKEILGQEEREILVFNHRINHCTFKYTPQLSKRGIILRKISMLIKIPPCVACLFGNYQNIRKRTKVKHSGGSTRKPS